MLFRSKALEHLQAPHCYLNTFMSTAYLKGYLLLLWDHYNHKRDTLISLDLLWQTTYCLRCNRYQIRQRTMCTIGILMIHWLTKGLNKQLIPGLNERSKNIVTRH